MTNIEMFGFVLGTLGDEFVVVGYKYLKSGRTAHQFRRRKEDREQGNVKTAKE